VAEWASGERACDWAKAAEEAAAAAAFEQLDAHDRSPSRLPHAPVAMTKKPCVMGPSPDARTTLKPVTG